MNENRNANPASEYQYAGFWIRFGASLLDTLILLIFTLPLLAAIYGDYYWSSASLIKGPADVLISYVFPFVATILFWIYKSATPGKMAVKARIVDARTGKAPTVQQSVIRYIGYIVSTIPLCLGFLWIAWDSKKQGWHDKMAGTVVIRPKDGGVENVEFSET
ncbi:RDD family protein [Microbulbifer hainanensis]|uniref:RDD family protein n=1 Tax=Microbulbifer hainanensis TaxID=2735675 RepID=UPI001866AFE7|nr:RDD family protein [Microbulbifer hainanensis]